MAAEDVIPTLILCASIYFIYRYLTSTKTAEDAFRHVRREMVDVVHGAFPDVPVDSIVYSLTRTRSAQGTSEIILERGGLPSAPAGFIVPDHLRPDPPAPRLSTEGMSPSKISGNTKPASLIERYGLGKRVEVNSNQPVPAAGKWEATREERERDLRTRKERMILAARQRMLEKEQTNIQ